MHTKKYSGGLRFNIRGVSYIFFIIQHMWLCAHLNVLDALSLGAEQVNCLIRLFAKCSCSMWSLRVSVAATCHCLWQGNGEKCEGIQAGRRDLLPWLLLSMEAFRSLFSWSLTSYFYTQESHVQHGMSFLSEMRECKSYWTGASVNKVKLF